MKICLITEYFYPEDSGGTPTALSQLMRYMKDHYSNFEIDVITSNNLYRRAGGKLPKFEDWDGIRILRVNSPRSNRPSTALRLLTGCIFSAKGLGKLFTASHYDLIVVSTNPPSAPILGKWLRQRYGTPYCYLIHDLYPDIAIGLGALGRGSGIARFAKRWQHNWLHGASSIAVLGRCMRERLVSEYGVPRDKIEVITSWCDSTAIVPMSKETAFRATHGLTGFLVIYAGNIGHSQGLGAVVDAAKLLQTSNPDITFVLVGVGDAWNELAERVSYERISNIRLIPAVPATEYPEVLASADVSLVSLAPDMEGLAVPSKSYNILSSGRPMIAIMGKSSEIAQMINECNCGVQVDHGDAEQLAEAVTRLYGSPELLHQMSDNARSALVGHYSIEHIAEKFHCLFQITASQR